MSVIWCVTGVSIGRLAFSSVGTSKGLGRVPPTMNSLPVEVLLGIYLGLLTGIVPALVAGALGFVVRYFTGVTLPGFGVVVLALSIASVQGGLLGLVQPEIAQSPRLLVAVVIVLMLSLYAHSQGDQLGEALPRRVSLTTIRQRTLSADVVELVGHVGRVRVRTTGEVRDMEGYPPLSDSLRNELKNGSWELPADIPLSELEFRLEERLRTDYALADVVVSIDERARATIVAAPSSGNLSRRIPDGHRAISIDTLVPTGLARGDRVTVLLSETDRTISGIVLSASGVADEQSNEIEETTDSSSGSSSTESDTQPPADSTASVATASPRSTTASAGGTGRVTIIVPRRDARPLLETKRATLVVESRGSSREFEAVSALKRAGHTIQRITVGSRVTDRDNGPSIGDEIRILGVRRHGVETPGRRHEWTFGTGIQPTLSPNDDAFLAGTEADLEAFTEAIRR